MKVPIGNICYHHSSIAIRSEKNYLTLIFRFNEVIPMSANCNAEYIDSIFLSCAHLFLMPRKNERQVVLCDMFVCSSNHIDGMSSDVLRRRWTVIYFNDILLLVIADYQTTFRKMPSTFKKLRFMRHPSMEPPRLLFNIGNGILHIRYSLSLDTALLLTLSRSSAIT